MRIGLDVMGGDYAPEATLLGASDVLPLLSHDQQLVLIGDQARIHEVMREHSLDLSACTIHHCPDVIGMGDHPSKSYARMPDSSIAQGFKLLHQQELDGFCSAGNTGAMLVGASVSVKAIPGIIRPALALVIPGLDDTYSVILDVGLNPDCKPDVLYQFGILGSLYAEYVLDKKDPSVGILNIGSEDSKGNLVVRSAIELMHDSPDFHFAGSLEANAVFGAHMTDVIVCDGFIGNIIIKEAEGFYSIHRKRGYKDAFFEKLNFENIGGTPIVGINSNVIIGHGISNRVAIKNMILQTVSVIQADLTQKIKEAI